MDTPVLFVMFLCVSICSGSHEHHSHTIPVEGYETELQDLGQHVEIPETPVRVIKITKTIAVKVPVPYPVKVIEKVPYPVHVNKPYPVPVPQIVHVPQPAAPKSNHEQHQQALDIAHGYNPFQNLQENGNSYQVQEGSPNDNAQNGHYEINNHDDGNDYSPHSTDYSSDGSPSSYHSAPNDYYGDQDGHNSNSNIAIQNFYKKLNEHDGFGRHKSQNH